MKHAVRISLSVLLLVLGLNFAVTAQTVKPFVTVDAARYQPAVAPDSIVAGFSSQLTTQEAWATEDFTGIDVFSPIRHDWVDGTDDYLRHK